MDVRTNGNLKISLALLITIALVIVNSALTVNNKVDRDKVQACELRINTLEAQQKGTDNTLQEIKDTLEKIRGENKEILQTLARVEAMYGSGK